MGKINNKIRPTLDSLLVWPYKNKSQTLFSPAWLPFGSIANKINSLNPDIVHLHWINAGFLSIKDLSKIKAPIVWSLHDMWAFTGGCHYDDSCGAYKANCGNCKVLRSTRQKDISRRIWNLKRKIYSKIPNLTIIALSKWMMNEANKSSLFKNTRVVNLPNPIDTTLFKPIDKEVCRNLWGLPKDKTLLLFGAMNATSDTRKGFERLSDALSKLKKDNLELVVFGSSKPQKAPPLSYKIHYLGHVNDDVSLTTIYNAADVMIVPSLQENLSNAIMESLACATPVVGFDIGGNSDMIEHKKNGYLAAPFDSVDLAFGIEWIIENSARFKLSENARQKVEDCFDSRKLSQRYLEIYTEIITKKSSYRNPQ